MKTTRQNWSWAMATGGLVLSLVSLGCGTVDPKAREDLFQTFDSLEMTVYSAAVRQREQDIWWDEERAIRIATALDRLGVGTVSVCAQEVPLSGGWHANQPKMLEESALAIAAYLADHPAKTSYAFLPEFLLGRSGHAARIHGILVDASGRVAMVILTNSKWEGFDQGKLNSPPACAEYLIGRLEIEFHRP